MPINKKVGISLAVAMFGYACYLAGSELNEPRCPMAINEVPAARYQMSAEVGPVLQCYYVVEVVRPMNRRKGT